MEIRKVFSSVFSYTLYQAFNYITPVLLMPFIIKTVGIENFGISNYILSCFIVLKIIADFGYNISAIKLIVEAGENEQQRNVIFSRIFFTKVYLLILLFLLVLLFTSLNSKSHYNSAVILTFSVVIGQTMIPLWFFQAMQKVVIITFISFFVKVIYVLIVIFFLRKPSDYIYINFYLGFSDLLIAVIAYVYLFKYYSLKLKIISAADFIYELKINRQFALSNILIAVLFAIPLTILGQLADKFVIGFYGVAEKILQIFRTSASILHTGIFSRVIKLYHADKAALKIFFKQFHTISIAFYLLLAIMVYFFPEQLIRLIIGSTEMSSISVNSLKILSIAPLIAALQIMPGQLLIIKNQQKKYLQSVFYSVILGVFTTFFLIKIGGYVGAAISYVLIELTLLFYLNYYNRHFKG
ncbi:MAG: oligosaccharide flippase family protein [Chitinophagaceae bacterium]